MQESPGLKPDLFEEFKAVRLVGNFLNIAYHLSYEVELRWVFSSLTEKNQC